MVTTTSTTASTTTSATQSLLTSLNTGSGVDIATLVPALVKAQFDTRSNALTAKSDALTKQISGVATLKSTVTAFSKALDSLVTGGTLQTQPTVSDSTVLAASALPGAKLAALSASVTVERLASAQGSASGAIVDKDGQVAGKATALSTGASRFTLTLGTATYAGDGTSMTGFTPGAAAAIAIDVPAANSSPAGIAAAINAKRAGVTATVVTGANGASYLSLKGATGTSQAFTLDATVDPDGTMAQFRVMPPVTDANGNVTAPATANLTGRALNAKLSLDGIAVERAGNTVDDLVDGVKLQLSKASATPVVLGATRPTEALTQAVTDFVDTYNQVLGVVAEQTNATDGALRTDPAAKALLRSLQGITLKSLVPNAAAGSPSSLAQIGVGTNKDGTLVLTSATLTKALAADPDAVEAMFASSATGSTGLSAVLKSLSTQVADTTYGLGASTTRYTNAQKQVTTDQAKVTDQSTALTTRLTKQYTSMNTAVTAYKATQAFIEQQVKIWTKSE